MSSSIDTVLAVLLVFALIFGCLQFLRYGRHGMVFGAPVLRTIGEVRAQRDSSAPITYVVHSLGGTKKAAAKVGVEIVLASGSETDYSGVGLSPEEARSFATALEDTEGSRLPTFSALAVQAFIGETAARLNLEEAKSLAQLLREAAGKERGQ